MEFTREQLERHDWRLAGEIADFALRLLDKIEGLELDAEDAREDIDSLDQHVVELRAKLESAEAERDILQWASDHSGGEDKWKVVDKKWFAHKLDALGNLISSEPVEPDPHPEGEACDVGECSCNMGEPSRPHEALVWAIFRATAVLNESNLPLFHADDLLSEWRSRWPEPKA